jgi:hypothetical protein
MVDFFLFLVLGFELSFMLMRQALHGLSHASNPQFYFAFSVYFVGIGF